MLLAISNAGAQFFSPFEIEKLTGKKAPEFTINDLSGKGVSLSSFAGKPILLNFWATWCPYCREERAYLNSIYKEYKDKGLVIIAVSIDKSAEIVRNYLKRMPADFVILHDNNNDAASTYGVYSLPTNFLIDRNGIIKHRFIGLRDWTDKESKKIIETLIKD
jgi:peroxiredoxin